MEPLTFGSILALILPLLIKYLLPSVLQSVANKIFNPPTPLELANANRDEALVKGDLKELGRINELVIDKAGVDDLTTPELNNLLKLVSP